MNVESFTNTFPCLLASGAGSGSETSIVITAAGGLIALAAVFSYANHRWLKLPTTIGIMVMSLALSLVLLAGGTLLPDTIEHAKNLVDRIDFNEALMHGMLGYLLFAGALHVKLEDLARQKFIIGSLATAGVIVSTLLVSGLAWLAFGMLGLQIDFAYCLLFGALISPTDPISVLGIMRKVGAPKSLETKMSGESLFNDGVGVVVFLGIFEAVTAGHGFDPGHVGILFFKEVVGGVVYGLVIGMIAFWMLKTVDNYQVEILVTLAVVAGGYPLAMALHVSGPIAMVVAGLLIGNHGRSLAMSPAVCEHLDTFWELVDEILNAVLFLLIGLEVLVLTLSGRYVLAGALAVPIVLLARFLSVGGAVQLLRLRREFTPHAVKILTWGGLRGGISVALALSLPRNLGGGPEIREVLLTATYVVVAFSIIVQGLTIGSVIKRLAAHKPDDPPESEQR